MIVDQEKIDGLVRQCRLIEANAQLALARSDLRLRAGLCALQGDDAALARVVDPALLACHDGARVAEYYAASELQPNAYDHLVAGVVLAWAGDAAGAYTSLHAAYDRAISERCFDVAVGIQERLAHYALLFGDVELSRDAIAQAIALGETHSLTKWLVRALSAGARIAFDAGDLEAASQHIACGRAAADSREEMALFAGTGAQLALELGDEPSLREWTSQPILDIALRSEHSDVAISATIAGLVATMGAVPNEQVADALRRAMVLSENAARAPELFSLGARYAPLPEGRRAIQVLAAAIAPERPYLQAHQLLARAYVSLRSGERLASIDSAGDAARAFSAMGLRRWTNEAMRLLVSHEQSGERRTRGRTSGSALTEREEQVAQLIRRGARNREVAKALQISEHTVERHVSSILGRLGLRSRWQIAEPRGESES